MSKHTNAETPCPLCEKKLLEAHPDLQDWFRDIIKPAHPDTHISWSFRDMFNQNQAHAEGKSKLGWPLSMHNKSDDQGNPCSLALDLFQLASNGMACWPWKWFKGISETSKKANAHVDWGHDLWGWDADHFQLKN